MLRRTTPFRYTRIKFPLLVELTLILTILLSGCASTSSVNNWPISIPERSIFVEAFRQQQASGTNSNTLEPHLVWIKRFYLGSVLYPTGWNRMTQMLMESLKQDVDAEAVEKRMRELGLKISIEWAQDNRHRNIDSSAIAVWGNALRTASELGEQLDFVDKIESDVADLLSRKLTATQIVRERYYPEEDFDDF